MTRSPKTVIGTNTYVKVSGISLPIVAKVDTGADGTSLWASDVYIDDTNAVCFKYLGPTSPQFDDKIHRHSVYRLVKVVSSTGDTQIRFQIKQPITLKKRKIVVWCTLADRSERTYPMLIGKRTLKNKFIVDVSISDVGSKKKKTKSFNDEFLENPELILNKYRKKGQDD